MKKFHSILLVLCMLFCVVACNTTEPPAEESLYTESAEPSDENIGILPTESNEEPISDSSDTASDELSTESSEEPITDSSESESESKAPVNTNMSTAESSEETLQESSTVEESSLQSDVESNEDAATSEEDIPNVSEDSLEPIESSDDSMINVDDAPRGFVFTSFGDLKELKSALTGTDEELLAHMQAKSYYAYGVTTREVAQSIITLFERLETVYIDEASGYKAEWIEFTPEDDKLYVQYFNSARHRIEVYSFIDMQNLFAYSTANPLRGQLTISGNNIDLRSSEISEYVVGTLTTRNAAVALRIQKSGDNVPSGVTNISDNAYATITTFDFTK